MSRVDDLPFGKGKRLHACTKVVDYLIGDWQVNGIADVRSGVPVNLTVSGDIANTGNVGYMRPNVIGDWHVDNPTPARWFNTSALAAPAPFTFGNAGRNILRADALHRFDMSVFPSIPINQPFSAQLRLPAYTRFNTLT